MRRQIPDIWEEHKRLYHYTNWDGLSGILKARNLWATHYRFLNDSSEFTLFGDKLFSFLQPAVRDEYEKFTRQDSDAGRGVRRAVNPASFATHFVRALINEYYRVTDEEAYIASFCGEHKEAPYIQSNGLLSQWRAYGIGGGFALVFDTRRLWDLLVMEAEKFPHDAMHLSSCVYSDDEDVLQQEFCKEIGELSESTNRFVHRVLSREVSEQDRLAVLKESLWPFLFCCTRYKHRGFKEENEVRLVIGPAPQRAAKDGIRSISRQFRYKNGECVPYVSLFDSTNVVSAIDRIIVGPHKEKTARAAALRVMLGDQPIEITCSDIPFVG